MLERQLEKKRTSCNPFAVREKHRMVFYQRYFQSTPSRLFATTRVPSGCEIGIVNFFLLPFRGNGRAKGDQGNTASLEMAPEMLPQSRKGPAPLVQFAGTQTSFSHCAKALQFLNPLVANQCIHLKSPPPPAPVHFQTEPWGCRKLKLQEKAVQGTGHRSREREGRVKT